MHIPYLGTAQINENSNIVELYISLKAHPDLASYSHNIKKYP